TPPATAPARVPAVTGDRTLLYEDVLRSGPRRAAASVARYLTSKARHRPYRPVDVAWETSPSPDSGSQSPPSTAGPARVGYVGWVGKENMGDEAMLAATRGLMPWAEVAPDLEHAGALLLGGGTLINRKLYLDWLKRKDSPRLERFALGTGVADPTFWGPAADPAGWVDFLETCAYVGLRGPQTLATLRRWGYRGDAEIVGDVALALPPPRDVEAVAGRLVVSPAWTGGELWGGSDAAVFAAIVDTVRTALGEGREVVFLSCFPGDDRHIFEMMRSAGAPDLPYLAGYEDIEAAFGLVASAATVVAERLHAAVLAAGAGTPFVAIEYRPKVRDFAASLGVEHLVLRSDALGDGALADASGRVLTDAEAIGGVLQEAVDGARHRLRSAADVIRSSLPV
ncbi:MAG: polysaccharide pyruvyl transferase family protein, partial [Acidimicrobiia bacterium]